MVSDLRWRFTIIALVVGFFAYMAYKGITRNELELGIDLKGGSELIFKFEFEEQDSDVRQGVLTEAIGVIEERIDRYGLKDIVIQPIGDDRFSVQISAQDKEKVDPIKDLITDLGELNFRITVEPTVENYQYYWNRFLEQKKKGVEERLAAQIPPEDLKEADRARYPDGLQWFPLSDRARGRNWAGRVPTNEAGDPQPWILCELDSFDVTGEALHNVFHARAQEGIGTGWAVYFRVKKFFQRNMAALTSEQGSYMAIILNGRLDSAPELIDQLSDSGRISGGFTEETSRSLAAVLQAGSLKQKPTLISERTIAPDLAGDARTRGVMSTVIGFGFVLCIMAWLYLGPGLLANVALLLNLVLLVGVLTWFNAVLTLPGIAGVVLTVGMAVDANILVFERIKEELRRGRTVTHAVATGYDRALVTIVDANLTTLITAYFLFQIGSGPVRGFGITLAVGIVASMFTALYVTRTLFGWLFKQGWMTEAKMRGVFSPPKVAWMSMTRTAIHLSAIAMVAGVILWEVVPDKAKYDLDFTQGSKLILRFNKEMNVEAVEDTVAGLGAKEPLFRDVSVRASAEGLGASVTDETGRGFELRSQNIARAIEIESFKTALKDAFQGDLLPGPFQKSFVAVGSGSSRGTLYMLNENTEADVLQAAIDQYTRDTGRLKDTSVQAVAEVPVGAKTAFELTFREPPENAGQISLNVRRAFSEFKEKLDAARTFLREAGKDEEKTATEQERAKAQLAAIEGLKPDDLGLAYFAECDPFPLADRIDPSTAQQHRDAAMRAIALSILGIIAYVAFRFRSWSFGFAAVVALVHDVLVVLGMVALANWAGVVDARLNLVTVAAFLTLIGYSINDSIVIFDRIRENTAGRSTGLASIIDRSVNETISRTIRTTTTTWIVVLILLAMNFGTNSSLEGFAFILALGVLVGTYSSIFIASPTLLYLPWLWEKVGGDLRLYFRSTVPYMVGVAVLLLGVSFAHGALDFSRDFSVPLFNALALSLPVGILAHFLVNFLRFVRREDAEPAPV